MASTIRSFMFHDVRDIDKNFYPKRYELKSFLPKKKFELIISEIYKKYKIIKSEELLNIDLNIGHENYATLTFDDGLLDHYYVFNFLNDLKIPATFLIPMNPIINKKLINSHKIQFILASTDEKKIVEEILSNFENKELIWETYSKSQWIDNWWSKEMVFITNFLRKHKNNNFNNYDYSNYLFNKFVSTNEEEFAEKLYLTEKNIDEICSVPYMTIGGHGFLSENLLLMDSYENEINESYNFIKKYSKNFIFSYPNGGYDEKIKNVLNKNNCLVAYTTQPKTITDLDSIDFLEFPRYDAPQKIKLK